VEDVVFQVVDKKFSPYSVNRSTMKVGGELQKNTYTYAINDNYPVGKAFKLPNSAIVASEKNLYEVYGGRGYVKGVSSKYTGLVSANELQNSVVNETTTYSFYLSDATRITFDFSIEPTYKNFENYDMQNLKRGKVYHFEFTMPAGTAFSWAHDGTVFATKEKTAVSGTELCIVEHTLANDFIIYEYAPGDKVVYDNVKVIIHNVKQEVFHIDSIAIKEICETGVAVSV